MVTTRIDAEAQAKVWEMVREIEVAMVVTMDEEGRFRSRPMRAAGRDPDGTLWFFTSAGSPKTAEVAMDGRVLLAYADPRRQNYVSISGNAEVVKDPAKQKELWTEAQRLWFPRGSQDPAAVLLKVVPDGAEYWDAPSSTLVLAYGYVKAVTTGRPPQPGANDKVDFSKAG